MKNLLAFAGVILLLSLVVFSCKDKNTKDAIKPDYGATGNPYPENQTVTGSTTYTNPATKNSSFEAGGFGWVNPTCVSTNSLSLRAMKDNMDVMIVFASVPTSTTYVIGPVPANGVCALTILNAPEQPEGLYWYGKSGSVEVTKTGSNISAKLSGVICSQKEFGFPQVYVSGNVGCN